MTTTETKTFYLTEVAENYAGLNAKRLCITTNDRKGRIKSSVDATCFFDAKLKFGFELTPIQSDLFE